MTIDLRMKHNDGMTLKNGTPVNFKTGFQVATEGVEVHTAKEARAAIKAYNGNCGIWFTNVNGVRTYYVDKSHRVNTKKEALKIGRECNQISVLKWADKTLVYC